MEAIAGGAGGEKLSEFRTFLSFICSGKGKKEKIYFQTYIKKCTTDVQKVNKTFGTWY